MKTRYKIILIVGIVIIIGFASIFLVPVFWMIGLNMISGHIISTTTDETFEEDFAKIPEVKFFIEKYPDYTTGHSADFLAWKIIDYNSKIDTERFIHLEVKKSVLHQKVKVAAGCSETGTNFGLYIMGNRVMEYLKNDQCLLAEELADLCIEPSVFEDGLCVFIMEDLPEIISLTDDEINDWNPKLGPEPPSRWNNSPYRDCPRINEKLHNMSTEELQANYDVFPGGVGYVHKDHINMNGTAIYMDNPDNPGEKIMDLDAMMKLSKPTCSFYEKAIFSEQVINNEN